MRVPHTNISTPPMGAHAPPTPPRIPPTPPSVPLPRLFTTPTETVKLHAMPTCATGRGGVIGTHTHGNVGRQVADDQDDQDDTPRGGTIALHTHGNTARHVVDDLNAKGSVQQKP